MLLRRDVFIILMIDAAPFRSGGIQREIANECTRPVDRTFEYVFTGYGYFTALRGGALKP